MPTLILSPRYTEDSAALREVARALGWNTVRLESWRVPEGIEIDDPVLYGEPYFAEVVASSLSIALLGPHERWLSELPENYVLREVITMTLEKARNLTARRFVKPCNDKSFPAQVYESGVHHASADVLPEHTLVQVAEPIEWGFECRAFVLDRRVQTMALYKRCGVPTRDGVKGWPVEFEEYGVVSEFLERVLADKAVECPPAVVIDVGEVIGRGLAVVEANEAWGSGVYGCKGPEVLGVVRKASMPRSAVDQHSARWVLNVREVK